MSFNQPALFSDKADSSSKKDRISNGRDVSRLYTSKVKLSGQPSTALEEMDPLVADVFINLSIEKGMKFEDFFLRQVNDSYKRADDLDKKLFVGKLNSMVQTREQVAKLAKELKKA